MLDLAVCAGVDKAFMMMKSFMGMGVEHAVSTKLPHSGSNEPPHRCATLLQKSRGFGCMVAFAHNCHTHAAGHEP